MRTSKRQTTITQNKLPITQLDFGYSKGFDDSSNITLHTTTRSGDFLTALITALASKSGNITTRNSGAHSSQSQGRVERAHSTLLAQIRTLKAQIRRSYNRDIALEHPLMPWIVRHSAYIMNRIAIHSNGCTSYFNRWNKERHTNHFATNSETISKTLSQGSTTGSGLARIQLQASPSLGPTTRLSEQGQSEGK